MHILPPLNALRAFEAAARCGSFVLAATELGVSSAAVSLQVKSLEKHLGRKLFLRQGNRILLTDAGEVFYPGLARAFGEISDVTQLLRKTARGPKLVISVLPALAENWLLPRLAQFRAQTDIALDIRVEHDPVDFLGEAIDIRLTYSTTYYADYRKHSLFPAVSVPVCTPDFWDQYGDRGCYLCSVPEAFFIHNIWGPEYWSEPNWQQWMKQAGRGGVANIEKGMQVSDLSLAISAAKQNLGMALVPETLIQGDVAKRALICPSNIRIDTDKEYISIVANARAGYRPLQDFRSIVCAENID